MARVPGRGRRLAGLRRAERRLPALLLAGRRDRCAQRCGDLPAAECDARVEEAQAASRSTRASRRICSSPTPAPEDWLDCGQCRDCFKPSLLAAARASPRSTRWRSRTSTELDAGWLAAALPLRLHRLERQPQGAARHRLQAVRAAPDDGRPRRRAPSSTPSAFRPRIAQAMPETADPRRACEAARGPARALRAARHRARRELPVSGRPGRRPLRGTHAPADLGRARAQGSVRHERPAPPALVRSAERAGWAACRWAARRASREAPRFEVRAVGAFVQKPGCPD